MTEKAIVIDGRPVGRQYPPFIIAEMSANHNGSLERALRIIDMAKAMGADAVKLQTYAPETMTIDCDRDDFRIHGGLWDGYSLYQLYKEAQTPFAWHETLFRHARETGITCFSTPFDVTAVDLLEELGTPAYKVASFELVDLELIRYIGRTGKPMILSTGMATVAEIDEAVKVAHAAGAREIALLHCVSGYPVPVDQSDIRTIPDLAARFDVVTGLSDHTLGTAVSVAAVALGASLLEKHVTLSRQDAGADSAFSLEPEELQQLCVDARTAWSALGSAGYERRAVEKASLSFRRSIYFVKDISAGEQVTAEHIRVIRPGYGLAPRYFQELIGRRVRYGAKRGQAVGWDIFIEQG